ncbi:unnamed protein product [Staurois parvus]|uniref:SAND domain-containing protein n=1 Tax=Staurois parvus TaxID=386267 RepID=A0ABN9DWP7_9NEOB|nr:unnamed protein product [Staurois parvus]
MGLLSKLELLKLQADKRMAKDVLYDALSLIQERRRIEVFFDYVFREFNLNRFPALKTILFNMDDIMMQETRKCRLKPICYTELSDHDWEFIGDGKKHAGVKSSLLQKLEKVQHQEYTVHISKDGNRNITRKHIKDAKNVKVRLEYPKQIFNDEFPVRCGDKKGTFMREHWDGEPSIDKCIKCDGKMFTVIKFEKYGGKECTKNWKKSIFYGRIPMEKLFQLSILKFPSNIRRRPLL